MALSLGPRPSQPPAPGKADMDEDPEPDTDPDLDPVQRMLDDLAWDCEQADPEDA
ncbi:hypothetical protein HPT29_018460 [Microvirga terrae]|uniref:Uncharacterized protein n=1 Tax=Microvirga terrae TaxID=2740529 RepID=A0ABY5RQ58_9HYPH|nr:hypothetical protein [Microvirga terrae]UVF18456.1 hypothetical protein HPT29_018460 [Microvirga terrae]